MRSADKYARQTSDLLICLYRAPKLTQELDSRVNDFLRVLRISRWQGKYDARNSITAARLDLINLSKPKLTLIQGGNDFLARHSRAVLTLILTSELNNQSKKVG